jgi:hypothetical protein
VQRFSPFARFDFELEFGLMERILESPMPCVGDLIPFGVEVVSDLLDASRSRLGC